jgi:hypothetical protein
MLLAGSACLPFAVSQTPYHILPGEADADGCMPTKAARICLGAATDHCYAPPSTKDYIFGLEPKAAPAGNIDGKELILFTAMFSGCGSGTLSDFSLLTVRSGQFVNLLPPVRLSNQSEYKLWNLPRYSNHPMLVTADFIWNFDAGETHLAAHRYAIHAYIFDRKSGQYRDAVHYETKKKYPGFDNVDEIRVLGSERPTILAKLQKTFP